MGILSYRGGRGKQWTTPQPQREHNDSTSRTNRGNRRRRNHSSSNFFLRCLRLLGNKQLHNSRTWRSLSIHSDIFWARNDQPNDNTTRDLHPKCHRHNQYIYSVKNGRKIYRTKAFALLSCIGFLSGNPVLAQGVGGVSATANPIANSSGSVTNQAIQVLQGPYITNTYGGGVQCQGSTFNLTPYIQFADSRKHPWEDFYNEPQYNTTDATGKMVPTYVTVKNYPWEDWYDDRTYVSDGTDGNTIGETIRWFPDGSDISIIQDIDSPNGVPDVVDSGGSMAPSWYKPVRTDMRANQSFNVGLSATLSVPLNRKFQRQCHEAAAHQNEMAAQLVANKRLDFEIARLKNCGELKKDGIMFHPKSPYYSVCADVVVTAPGGRIVPHEHQIPQPKWTTPSTSSGTSEEPTQLDSDPVEQDVSQKETVSSLPSPKFSWPWQRPSLSRASQLSGADQLGVLQVGQSLSQPEQ